jgi:hypothetical protein
VFLGGQLPQIIHGAQASDMDYILIAPRTESLRREIERIQQAEVSYRSRRAHSSGAQTEHDSRALRLLAIRAELLALSLRGGQPYYPPSGNRDFN